MTGEATPEQQFIIDSQRELERSLAARGLKQQEFIVRNVSVSIVDDPAWLTGAVSRVGEYEVLLSTGYIAGLYNHIAARFLEARFGRSNLAELQWRHRRDAIAYDDIQFVTIEDLAQLSPAELKEWRGDVVQQEVFLMHSLAWVYTLAHEFAHHVLAEIQPEFAGPELESACDAWAAEALIGMGIPPIHGAAMSFDYFQVMDEEMELFIDERSRSHPYSVDRAANIWADFVERALPIYEQRLGKRAGMAQIEAELEILYSLRAEAARRKRERNPAQLEDKGRSGDFRKFYVLSQMFEHGLGVPRDRGKGFDYALLAATLGNPPAQVEVGVHLYERSKNDRDEMMAYLWLRMAAVAGYKSGQANVTIVSKNYSPALKQAAACLDANHIEAFAACRTDRRSACLSSCIGKWGHAKYICRNVMCASERQREQEFIRCAEDLPAPERAVAACVP